MAGKSSDLRSSSNAFANHEFVLGPPSDAIPRLLSALSYCFDQLVAESHVLADTNVVQRQDFLASARSASVLSESVPAKKRPAEAEQFLESGLPTDNEILNLDDADEVELENEANDQVLRETPVDARWRPMKIFLIDDVNCSIPDEMGQDESLVIASENFGNVNVEPAEPKLHLEPDSAAKVSFAVSKDAGALEIENFDTEIFTVNQAHSNNAERTRGPRVQRSSLDSSMASTVSSNLENFRVMPEWYSASEKSKGDATLDTSEIFSAPSFGPRASTGYCCILEPAGRVRLTWDTCWCMLLMFEIWATPIRMVFVGDRSIPQWWEVTLLVSFSFFCADIVLNFFTGFVEDGVDIMDQRRIVWNYLKYWFLFDVAATIPWNWFVGEEHGTELSSTSATKGLKVIRMMKLVRAAKLIRIINSYKKVKLIMSTSNVQRRRKKRGMKHGLALWSILQTMRSVVSKFVTSGTTQFVVPVLVLIAVLAHFHAIIWAALQDEWSTTSDMSLVFNRYFESCWWAISSFTFGNTYAATKPQLWLLDIVVLFERLILCTWIARRVVVEAIMTGDDESQMKCREALKYMEEHDITLRTELQILTYWNDLGKKRKRQRWFSELVHASLPLELQRRINQEMWSNKLRSLGLIEYLYELSGDFVFQLSQLVNEDVYASTMLVCKEGDPAKAAYHINSGELTVHSEHQVIEPFKAGMWIGEKALVNPDLRRHGSVIAKAMSTLLTVPAPAFFQLLVDFGIDQQFKQFCENELWKGLCGRCGQVGDHWAHECPSFIREQAETAKEGVARMTRAFSGEQRLTNNVKTKPKTDLSLYLGHYKLDRIEDRLQDMGIYNLDDLDEGAEYVQEELRSNQEALKLSPGQLDIFSAERVRKFRKMMAAQTSALMKACTSFAGNHYIFLSHYKLEAGTEAALMRAELESLIQEDNLHPAYDWKTPVYLDSEDLTDLHVLMDEVSSSHNLILMLTKGVLTRPWCLLEIATAARDRVPVIPVNILKAGCEFTFPDDNFYKDLCINIGSSGVDLIEQHGFEIEDVVHALKGVFKRIAVPYSPHRPASIRRVELQGLLKQATLRSDEMLSLELQNMYV